MNDLKFAFRQLRKNPGFTAVAVLTLALGIGANLALFTLLDDQFLRPRAVLRPEELWQICPSDASGAPKFFHLSRPYYDGIRKYNRVFKDLISIHGLTAKLRTSDAWEEIFGNIVSANYFSFVGVHTVVGRGLLPADERPDANPVAVISYALWQKHFGGEQAIAGKILNLDGHTFEVVGVAPLGFVGLASHLPDCWVTSSAEKLYYPSPTYTLIGRLENGISPAAAADSLAPIVQEVTRMLHPVKYSLDNAPFDANNNSEFTRVALLRAGYGCKDRQFAHHDRGTLIKVNSLAGFGTLMVLLMAASNLANLLLARGLDRRKELATRLALGATRPALVRQLALEGVLLVALGTLAALVTLNGFSKAAPVLMSAVAYGDNSLINLDPDVRVVAFAAGIVLLIGAGFSLPPALVATRFDPFVALKDSHAGTGVREGRWSLRRTLVVAQVAGSLVLLSGVCLCLRTISQQLRTNVGFRPEPLIVAQVDLEKVGHTLDTAQPTCEELRRQFSLLPGVEAVGIMARRPFSAFQALVTDRLEGHEGTEVVFEGVHVGPDSFHALGIPLLAGREVTAGDFTAGRPVALVNERLVRQFWPDQWVLGKQIEFIKKKYEVIGIVRDARLETPTEAPRPTVYFAMDAYQARHPNFILRTRDHPESLIKPIRAELLKVHRRLGESEVFTMHEAMRRPFVAQRNVMNLLAEIGAVALGLTVLGVYGLTAYLVRRRTREIGIRLAVGAQRIDVARLILRFGLWLALAGVSLGLPAAICGSLLLKHVVFGVSPFDLPAFVVAAGVVTFAIVLACWLPARRAAKVDPMEALRYE